MKKNIALIVLGILVVGGLFVGGLAGNGKTATAASSAIVITGLEDVSSMSINSIKARLISLNLTEEASLSDFMSKVLLMKPALGTLWSTGQLTTAASLLVYVETSSAGQTSSAIQYNIAAGRKAGGGCCPGCGVLGDGCNKIKSCNDC